MSVKKWLVLCFFTSFCFVFIIFIFNFKVDSLGIIASDKNFLSRTAFELENGKIVAGMQDYDDRILTKHRLNHATVNPKTIAIGSSRTMLVTKNMFSEKFIPFKNYAVSGASIEDYMAITQIYLDKFNKFPENIIIGVDPWIFNFYNGQTRFVSIYDEYQKMLEKLAIKSKDNKNKIFKNFLYLFSLEYAIKNYNNMDLNFYISNTIQIDDFVIDTDGARYNKIRSLNPKKVKHEAVAYTKGGVYSLENFKNINKEVFEKFIIFLQENGTNVYIYLPPYHPYVYDFLSQNAKYKIINDIEKYLIEFAKDKNIKLFGSYNPHILNLDDSYFIDGMHPLQEAYFKIFTDLFN